jgi:hypothetical protein
MAIAMGVPGLSRQERIAPAIPPPTTMTVMNMAAAISFIELLILSPPSA